MSIAVMPFPKVVRCPNTGCDPEEGCCICDWTGVVRADSPVADIEPFSGEAPERGADTEEE